MRRTLRNRWVTAAAAAFLGWAAGPGFAQEGLPPEEGRPPGQTPAAAADDTPAEPVIPMSAADAAARTLAFAEDAAPGSVEKVREELPAVTEAAAPAERLSAVLRCLYAADGAVRDVVTAAAAGDWAGAEAASNALPDDPFASTNVRAFLARTLIAMDAFDEAAAVIEGVEVAEAVDPASLLFARAVCQHAVLDKPGGLATIGRLLAPASQVPERYQAVAKLMRQDLEDLEDNDLNKISKQMKNVQRKLRQGKSGEDTQGQEKRIVEGLDKMIEGLEAKLQRVPGQGPSGSQPDRPMDDSEIAGQTAPGEVDRRPVGKSAGWGDLPPKKATEARNLIESQFPPHYRRAVEEYYKKLAERE